MQSLSRERLLSLQSRELRKSGAELVSNWEGGALAAPVGEEIEGKR